MAKVKGTTHKTPTAPPLPAAAKWIWRSFVDLSAARQSAFSLQPISYSEIVAYQTVTGIRLVGWEVALIRELDSRFLAAVAKDQQNGPQNGR